MNFKEMSLGERLKYAREVRGLTQQQLADLVPMTQPALHNTENGRNKGTTKLIEIALALNISPIWLQLGVGEMDLNINGSNISPLPSQKAVPLISWVAAGSWSTIECRDIEGVVKDWVLCPTKHSEQTYALEVSGISMRNPNGSPSFEDGDIIFVDPLASPENKSCVIAYQEDTKETTFKQLIINENDQKYLVPLNPAWPEKIIKINGNTTIIGVVIGKWTMLR